MQLRAVAPAKINLTLSVLGQRPDGFHDLDSLFVPLDFGDDITVAAAPALTVDRSGPAAAGLPAVPDDLVWRAANALARYAVGPPPGAAISVFKRIPTAAGLGGGSADAAVTLRLLSRLWGLPVSDEQLTALAADLGSDVPFFLTGGPARVTGRGEIVTPLPPLPPFWVVFVTLPIPKQTGSVYRRLHQHQPWPRPDVDAALHAWAQADWTALAAVVGNSLAKPMLADYPELARLQQDVVKAGALLALMSGAGPTVFGIAPNEADAHAVAARLREQYATVYVARAVTAPGR